MRGPETQMHLHDRLRSLAVVSTLMARELVVLLRGSVILDGGPVATGHAQRAKGHSHIAELSPELPPAVPHNPVLALASIIAPTNDRDNVIHTTITVHHNARLIVEERVSGNATSNWTS